VRGKDVGIAASAEAPPEFLVLLLEAGRFATYVSHMKGEGWSNLKAAGWHITQAGADIE
jgi:hypothetical protein